MNAIHIIKYIINDLITRCACTKTLLIVIEAPQLKETKMVMECRTCRRVKSGSMFHIRVG